MSNKIGRRIMKRVNKKAKELPAATVITKQLKTIKEPVIVADEWGMRFAHYFTDSETLDFVVSKDFYKPELLAMRRLVKEGDLVVDVGANVGTFSVFLSKEVGAKGRVHSFEPIRDTYWRLQENIALNRCENISPYCQAISNKKGTAIMNVFPEGHDAWNSFGKPKFDEIVPISTEKVAINTLDKFTKKANIKKIDFLKIDVEGYERDVLRGAKELLSNNRVKYLSFEISAIPLKGAGRTGAEVFDLLREYEYLAYEFNPDKNKFVGPIETSETFYQNFYASRSDLRKL